MTPSPPGYYLEKRKANQTPDWTVEGLYGEELPVPSTLTLCLFRLRENSKIELVGLYSARGDYRNNLEIRLAELNYNKDDLHIYKDFVAVSYKFWHFGCKIMDFCCFSFDCWSFLIFGTSLRPF